LGGGKKKTEFFTKGKSPCQIGMKDEAKRTVLKSEGPPREEKGGTRSGMNLDQRIFGPSAGGKEKKRSAKEEGTSKAGLT